MKRPNVEQQRKLVKAWSTTGAALAELRREALRDMPYRQEDVIALLELGDTSAASRTTSGLIEMQRRFHSRSSVAPTGSERAADSNLP